MNHDNCKNEVPIAMINERLNRMEGKIDSLLEYKWTMIGKMTVVSTILSAMIVVTINMITK